MIDVQNLTKYYGPTRSLDDVSFSVAKGEVLGFLGPNGAGKSTTMRILAGLVLPSAGRALLDGVELSRANEKARRQLGFLPESAPLYTDMTLAQYLVYMAGLRGLSSREAKREMERTSELVNLVKERPRLIGNLSKGTRQRAALAQALLGSPPVLLLDEPTVGLDPAQINDVRRLIRSLQGQCTVVLSTHILPEVELTCSRIVIISAGRVAAQGTHGELVSRESASLSMTIGGDRSQASALLQSVHPGSWKFDNAVQGAVTARITPAPNETERAELVRRLVEAGLSVTELRVERPRLEDIFLHAIGRKTEVS